MITPENPLFSQLFDHGLAAIRIAEPGSDEFHQYKSVFYGHDKFSELADLSDDECVLYLMKDAVPEDSEPSKYDLTITAKELSFLMWNGEFFEDARGRRFDPLVQMSAKQLLAMSA